MIMLAQNFNNNLLLHLFVQDTCMSCDNTLVSTRVEPPNKTSLDTNIIIT